MTLLGNQMYGLAKQAFGSGLISWPDDTIKGVLIDLAAYTPNFSTHEFLSDIPSAAQVAISAALTGKTITLGVARADPIEFGLVTGPTCEAIVFIKWTGLSTTSRVITYHDDADILPVTPSGGNVTVNVDPGLNGIFAF